MEYEEFSRKVKQAFEDSKRRYGAVKLCRVLNGAGTPCSIKRVQRHMAEQGLRSVVVKKYSHHANHGSILDDKVNILKRDFGTETIIKMVHRYYLHPCAERRMDLSGVCHGFLKP